MMRKAGVGGYLHFALDEDQMAAQFKQCASDLIVTDRFDSVFLGTNSAFVGDFGKLRVMLRDANGFTMLPEGLFYIRTLTTQNGFLRIHAMSECGGHHQHAAVAGRAGAGVFRCIHGGDPRKHRARLPPENPHHRRNCRRLLSGSAGRPKHRAEHQQPRRIPNHLPGLQQACSKACGS